MTDDGKTHDRTAAIVYGSETGSALDYAEEVGRLLERLHFRTIVAKLDALEPVGSCSFCPKHLYNSSC